jgi:hypothetical protein
MKGKKRAGIALMLVSLMMLSTFAFLPSASAAPGYEWRDYDYPFQPYWGTALRYKMYQVDILNYQLPGLRYYVEQGVFDNDFLVSYLKITEFLYRSCDPDIWWFQDEMWVYKQLYGNYPGDANKPIPQSAVSQGKKVFQNEYIVVVELNNQIRKLTEDYQQATGFPQLIIYTMLSIYKQIRSQLVVSDMVMAYHILDLANSAVDAIQNSNGKVNLAAVGGPSDFELENQQQIMKWTTRANDDFDRGIIGLNQDPSYVRSKLDLNQQSLVTPSASLDSSAYTTAMKMFEKTLSGAGHALSMSGAMDFCMDSIVLMVPAAVGIVLCFGVIVRKRRNNA